MRHVESQRVKVGDGKYTIVLDTYELSNGSCVQDFYALRHGEPWRSLTGDGMVLALFHRIEELGGAAPSGWESR